MDDEAVSDAIAACRLLFGQAVMEIVAENKPVTGEAISEKIHQMFTGINPEPVMKLAISLLTTRADLPIPVIKPKTSGRHGRNASQLSDR